MIMIRKGQLQGGREETYATRVTFVVILFGDAAYAEQDAIGDAYRIR